MKIKIILFLVACITFSGCQSLQRDIVRSRADERAYRELQEIEEAVINMDAVGAAQEELNSVRRRITSMQEDVADNEFQALLAAWSGRLFHMEGRNSDAQREYQRSESLSPLNIPSRILSFRLEQALPQRLSMIDGSITSEGALGELLIERGRVLFDMSRFSEAVAAFDAAFTALRSKPFYEEAYTAFRSKAWELRSLEQDTDIRTIEIVQQGEITWHALIEITQNETDFLRFITAGRAWPAETIFSQLLDRGFIPLTQDAERTEWPAARPPSSELVRRSGVAWFLWHLNAELRGNRGLLTRYSARYANTPNARSPISDLAINSPFFDSILGCVESEFMSLPDGRNFMSGERIRGADFLFMLSRMTR